MTPREVILDRSKAMDPPGRVAHGLPRLQDGASRADGQGMRRKKTENGTALAPLPATGIQEGPAVDPIDPIDAYIAWISPRRHVLREDELSMPPPADVGGVWRDFMPE